MKSIYSFTVEKTEQVEEKTKETRKNKETGKEEEIEVSKKVEKKIPFEFLLKEPNRRQLEDADMEYSIEISRCIKKGILTKAMLAKKYSDTGGILTEKDADRLVDLYGSLSDLETQAAKMGIKTAGKETGVLSEKSKKISGEIALVRRNIVDLESSYQSLFNHTADVKAQNRVILWYLLNLVYYKGPDMEAAEPLFPGKTLEERVEIFYKKDEDDDELFRLVQPKVAALVSYWYFSGDPAQEDFDKIIKDLTYDPVDELVEPDSPEKKS